MHQPLCQRPQKWLPRQGSNPESLDSKSKMLPITPQGKEWRAQGWGIPLHSRTTSSAVRAQCHCTGCSLSGTMTRNLPDLVLKGPSRICTCNANATVLQTAARTRRRADPQEILFINVVFVLHSLGAIAYYNSLRASFPRREQDSNLQWN